VLLWALGLLSLQRCYRREGPVDRAKREVKGSIFYCGRSDGWLSIVEKSRGRPGRKRWKRKRAIREKEPSLWTV
jgi:hypothetical protein